MTTQDEDTASSNLFPSTSGVVTQLNHSICVVQAQVGARPVDIDSAMSGCRAFVYGRSQPNLGSYPRSQKNRCFRATWSAIYPWLEYSIAIDKAFCLACKNFSTLTSQSDTACTKVGFSTWSKAMEYNRGFKALLRSPSFHDSLGKLQIQKIQWLILEIC